MDPQLISLTVIQLVGLVDVQGWGSSDKVQSRLRDERTMGCYLCTNIIKLDSGDGDGHAGDISPFWGLLLLPGLCRDGR